MPLEKEIDDNNAAITTLRGEFKDGKPTEEQTKRQNELEAKVDEARNKEVKEISDYAATIPTVSQLIDLALLGNGLLRGEDLSRFIARSISLL